MKRTLMTSALLLTLSQPALALEKSEKSKNEIIGLSSGVVIGAAVAGPVGAVVAGLFGVMIADDVNDKKELTSKQQELEKNQQALVALENRYQELNLLAKQRERQLRLQPVSYQTQPIALPAQSSIQFKTASHQVEKIYTEQLDLLAQQLKQDPQLKVTLIGYADRRGEQGYNQALSAQRALSVKQYLLKQGVFSKQIASQAKGESQPALNEQNFENNVFDRRVVIQLSQMKPTLTAAN